jgi:hypothetical protein
MAHNCNIINGVKPSSDGVAEISLSLNIKQNLSITRINVSIGTVNYVDGMHVPFPFADTRALLYNSNLALVTTALPDGPFTSDFHAMSFTISGAGTYLLRANALFVADGSIATLQWKDTTGATLGAKSRHQTTAMRFANQVVGVVRFTGASRTVYVEVSEEVGTLRTVGETPAACVIFAQIIKLG